MNDISAQAANLFRAAGLPIGLRQDQVDRDCYEDTRDDLMG